MWRYSAKYPHSVYKSYIRIESSIRANPSVKFISKIAPGKIKVVFDRRAESNVFPFLRTTFWQLSRIEFPTDIYFNSFLQPKENSVTMSLETRKKPTKWIRGLLIKVVIYEAKPIFCSRCQTYGHTNTFRKNTVRCSNCLQNHTPSNARWA